MAAQARIFRGSPNLKAANVSVAYTQEQAIEYMKCKRSPVYFIENYAKIVSLDKGVVLMKLFPYQKRMIKAFNDNRNVLGMLPRQSGKSTIVAAYFAWYAIFHDNQNCVMMANKMATAREIFSRVQMIIEELPDWLQQGIVEWNKRSFTLENGTRCFCSATSASAIRGFSINLCLIDEVAHISPGLWEEFSASVIPTLSSSEKSKLICVTTPKGMNFFHKMWKEAEQGINGFFPVRGYWKEHPSRNQKWADDMRKQLGEVKYAQEVECEFNGSSNTLINGSKLGSLPFIKSNELLPGLHQFAPPIEGHSYVMLVDVSRGVGIDASAFVIIDITKMPYKVACTYADNNISTLVYPDLIFKVATQYNQSFVLVETNDLGQQVADTLYYDLEYENVYMSYRDDIKDGGGKQYAPGCRTTKRSKSIGCDRIKTIIENDNLEVNDIRIIEELSVFVRSGSTYKAEEGKHDDFPMCLVMFGYLTSTPTFEDLFDFSLKRKMVENQLQHLEDQMLPIGFMVRGDEPEEMIIVEPKGDTLWLGNANIDQFMQAFK